MPSQPPPTSPQEEATATQKGPVSSLHVNITLQSSIKLGKHIKGVKGKEKAQPPPDLVKCCACGEDINWRRQKVHAHPRLNVITCQVI